MDNTVTLIDYGVGNISAFKRAYELLGIPCNIATCSKDIRFAKRLILPGVGSFDWAIRKLNDSGLRPSLEDSVHKRSVPILGVCVGMQMMGLTSSEGKQQGLGWIDAEVIKLNESPHDNIILPHMGWNGVSIVKEAPLFHELSDPEFYFLHSYCIPSQGADYIACNTFHGIEFVSAICKGNIYGTQFHPEKSHMHGAKLLKNFSGIN